MGSKTPSVTTTSSAPPPEVMKRYNEVMDRASGVAETPYSAYGGQLTAGQNQTQQAATQGLGAAAFLGNSFYNQGSSALGQAAKLVSGSQPYFQQGADQIAGAQPYFQQSANAIAGAQPYFNQAANYNAQSTGPLNIGQYLSPYQQSVIDTTMAQVHQSDAMAQNGALGNAIKTGNAFGGDRAGLAAAELERNQGMNRNSTIAGLNNQNYAQALGAAQNEMARYGQAAQTSAGLGSAQFTAAQGLGALGNSQINAGQTMGALGSAQAGAGQGLGALGTSFGNLGTQYASTAREGFNAALAAGAQQQATEQAGLTAAYQQWQAAQQFPYAQTSWLSGIQSGLGSLSGGTGSTTAPAPNAMNQILGLGATAAGAFMASDSRVKENIQAVGKLFDGQRVYSYRYRGDPTTRIGLMAQDVEKTNPDAVREFDGIKHVDYESATDAAADKGRFAQGGSVMPFGGAPTFIPVIQMTTGKGPPAPPKVEQEKQQNLGALGSLAGKTLAGMGGPGDPMSLAAPGVSNSGGLAGPWVDPTAGLGGLYARGGLVPRLASGGVADGYMSFEDRMNPVREAIAEGSFDPVGSNYNTMEAASGFKDQGFGALASVPMPAGRPGGLGEAAVASAPRREPAYAGGLALPREIAGDDQGMPVDVMAYDAAPRRGLAPPASYSPPAQTGLVPPGAGSVPPAEERKGSLGGLLPYLSQEAKASLMATGLALMSSRSPNLGNAIGDAGQVGLGTYFGALSGKAATEAKAREADRGYALDVRKLDESAAQARQRIALQGASQSEAARHNLAVESKEFKPTYGVIGEDATTGGKRYGWINPNTQEVTAPPVVGADAAVAATEDLTGDAYLATLPVHQRTLVQKLAKYELDPRSLSNRGGHRERLMAAATRLNPEFDAINYGTRAATRKDFTSGKSAQNVSSFNTAIGHLGSLDAAIDKLGNRGSSWYNAATAPVSMQLDKDYQVARKEFDASRTAVADELTRAFRGSGGNVHDIKAWEKTINEADSPEALHSATKAAVELLRSRIEAVGDQYHRGMGTTGQAMDLLSPKARETVTRIEGTGDPAHAKPASTGPGKAPAKIGSKADYSALPAGAEFVGSDGKRYRKP